MKDIIKPIAVLAGICLVVTALLAYVNLVTEPIITAAAEEAAAAARQEVLSEAAEFEELTVEHLPEEVTQVFKGSNDSGYVFMLKTKGYGGDITMICGIRSDGSIEAVQTLSHSETSGIGSRVVGNNESYHENFVGKTAADYDSVDGISGATISSKAYKTAIEGAFKAYELVKEAKE